MLARFAKPDLLAIDDWLKAPLTDAERRDLLEVIEDRSARASTNSESAPPTACHAAIGEPSVADAICHRHHDHGARVSHRQLAIAERLFPAIGDHDHQGLPRDPGKLEKVR